MLHAGHCCRVESVINYTVVRMHTWARRTDVPCMVTYTVRAFDDNGLPALYMYYIRHISVANLYFILLNA